MSAHDTEDLLATLDAAAFYIRTQASLTLRFAAVLRVEGESLSLARGLLDAVGVSAEDPVPAAPSPVPTAVASPPQPAASRRVEPQPEPEPDWMASEPEELDPGAVEPEPEAPEPEEVEPEEVEELVEIDAEELEPERPAAPAWTTSDPLPDEGTALDEGDPDALGDLVEYDEAEVSPLASNAVSLDEDVGDPATFGEPEETEDLLRDASPPRHVATPDDRFGHGARTVGEAMGFGSDEEDRFDTDAASADRDTEVEEDDLELEVDEPGRDALVTIEDTSDPRSDLDGLSRYADSDLEDDDDSVEDEVIVRKDDGQESFDLMPEGPESDMSPDEEETFVADLADIERMKAKMDSAPSGSEDTSDGPSEHEVMLKRSSEPAPPRAVMSGGTPRAVPPRVGGPGAAPTPRVAVAGVAAAAASAGQPARAGVTAGLYGNPAVPTIRDRNEPKPRAAAIQIDAAQEQAAKGSSSGQLLEEEELLELGSSEDYGEEEIEGSGDGLSLEVQEYEELEEVEIEEDDLELEEIEEEEDVPLAPIDEGPTPAELDAMLHKAAAAVEQGDMEAGIDFYSDVLDSDPENVDAHVKRGRLYLDYGDYSRAMSDFMMAEELAPDNPEPQIAVGDLYFARKDYNRAIDYFNEALKMAPNHAMAFCRRGISHYYRKNYPQALEDLNRAEKIDADIPNIRTYITMAKKKVRK